MERQEAPEPPANLTATLKGAVIHRFCERYTSALDGEVVLKDSFEEVVKRRQADLADRLGDIDYDAAIETLLPLVNHYLESDVFARIAKAQAVHAGESNLPESAPGVSELPFKLRRPLGILSGAIDKLLVLPTTNGGLEVEIIDFKTNRISVPKRSSGFEVGSIQAGPHASHKRKGSRGSSKRGNENQFSLNFDLAERFVEDYKADEKEVAARKVAEDYQLQMQSYALAVRELCPQLASLPIRVTLHFLEPNIEVSLSPEMLTLETCSSAIDQAMGQIAASSLPEDYLVNPAFHCRSCNFLSICLPGRAWLRNGLD